MLAQLRCKSKREEDTFSYAALRRKRRLNDNGHAIRAFR